MVITFWKLGKKRFYANYLTEDKQISVMYPAVLIQGLPPMVASYFRENLLLQKDQWNIVVKRIEKCGYFCLSCIKTIEMKILVPTPWNLNSEEFFISDLPSMYSKDSRRKKQEQQKDFTEHNEYSEIFAG